MWPLLGVVQINVALTQLTEVSTTYQSSTRAVVTRLPVTSEKSRVGLLVCVFSIVPDDLCVVFRAFFTQ
jgi:hypothetical protein